MNEESRHVKRSTSQTTTLQNDLSQQLIFLFSDLNLRNNKHARSILIDDQYLPLKEIFEIKSMKHISTAAGDQAAVVMDAINLANNKDLHIKLHTEQLENGEFFIRRVPPFRYCESIKNYQNRMMIIEGWPLEKKNRPRWAISRVRTLLCNDDTATRSRRSVDEENMDSINTPVKYWRYDHKLGVINIEFKSDREALDAWINLERAASSQASGSSLGIEVYQLHSGDNVKRTFKLRIGEIDLTARSIELPAINDVLKGSLEPGSTDSLVDDQSNNVLCQDSTIMETPVDILPRMYNKVWESYGSLSLSQFKDAMNQLYQYHISLPTSVGGDTRDDDLQQLLISRRRDLYTDVLQLVALAKVSMNQGEIRALRGKDGYALSDSLGMTMLIYSKTPTFEMPIKESGRLSGGTKTPYDACLDVLGILRELNLDIHPSHYTYALRAACNESRWREASRLFLTQVDGDDEFNSYHTGGFVPIDVELAWEGLYAVACDSKMSESAGEGMTPCPASKRVFETAMKMSMISPSGQDRCKSEDFGQFVILL